MLDYNAIYAGFGEKVVYYLNQARQLDQTGNQYGHLTQKGRLIRLANLAWILMNQPADEDGGINLKLDDILNMLSDGEDERRISLVVLRSDMREVGSSIDIKLLCDSRKEKIFIKPMR